MDISINYALNDIKYKKSVIKQYSKNIKKYLNNNKLVLVGGNDFIEQTTNYNKELEGLMPAIEEYQKDTSDLLLQLENHIESKKNTKIGLTREEIEKVRNIYENMITMDADLFLENGMPFKKIEDSKEDKIKNRYIKFVSIFKIFLNNYEALLEKIKLIKSDEFNYDFIDIINNDLLQMYNNCLILKNSINNHNISKIISFLVMPKTYNNTDFKLVKPELKIVETQTERIISGDPNSIMRHIVEDTFNMELLIMNLIHIRNSNSNSKSEDNHILHSLKSIENDFKINNYVSMKIGGVYNKMNTLENNIINLTTIFDNINDGLLKNKKQVEQYSALKIRHQYYVIYLLSIFTVYNTTNNYTIYTYINKGVIEMYSHQIKEIINRMRNNYNNEKSIYTKFFAKYHYYTLINLDHFLEYILRKYVKSLPDNLKTTFVIDIVNSNDNVKFMFTLLSHFKTIIDIHGENELHPISIYARINDIKEGTKMFGVPEDDTILNKMIINSKICKQLDKEEFKRKMNDDKKNYKLDKHGNEEIEFTSVYDTKRYPDNSTIAQYMSFSIQLQKGKGIMMITYGYSGTGKTYTLFGKASMGVTGILQSTLNNIGKLEDDIILFRSYEIYGLGIAYPEYWSNNKNLYQEIYIHHINQNIKDKIQLNNISMISDYDKQLHYINDINSYHKINVKLFNSIDDYIESLDSERRNKGRIKITPNNPESSRSIIIYDFLILVKVSDTLTKYVPFVIIDLPGREEISESYVKTYLNDETVKKLIHDDKIPIDFMNAMLASIAINPFGLALLAPSIIFDTINELDHNDLNEIKNGLSEECIGLQKGDECKIKFNNLYDKTNYETDRTTNNFFKFIKLNNNSNKNKFNSQEKNIIINITSVHHRHVQGNGRLQYQCVAALVLIKKIIKLKKFHILEKIYENIIKYYFDFSNHLNIDIDNKKKYLDGKGIAYNINDNEEIIKKYKNLICFNSFKVQHEGIYINENIMGLLYYLIEIVVGTPNKIEKQPDLAIDVQLRNYRYINFNLYADKNLTNNSNGDIISSGEGKYDVRAMAQGFNKKNSDSKKEIPKNIYVEKDYIPYYDGINEIKMNNKILKQMYNNSLGYDEKIFDMELENGIELNAYSSKKIFNKNKPFMGEIIKIYQNTDIDKTRKESINSYAIGSINDIKIFYLFSNDKMDLKCEHQYNLLNITKPLINAVNKPS